MNCDWKIMQRAQRRTAGKIDEFFDNGQVLFWIPGFSSQEFGRDRERERISNTCFFDRLILIHFAMTSTEAHRLIHMYVEIPLLFRVKLFFAENRLKRQVGSEPTHFALHFGAESRFKSDWIRVFSDKVKFDYLEWIILIFLDWNLDDWNLYRSGPI